MIRYKEVNCEYFKAYDQIPMLVHVKTEYSIEKVTNGLGGMLLKEILVNEYAYYGDKECEREAQLIWYLNL